jgi:hypothetical protein
VFTVNVTQATDSAEDVTEKRADTHGGLVQGDGRGVKCQSSHNTNFNSSERIHYANHLTQLSENGSEIRSDQLIGTYPENYPGVVTNIYHNSPSVLDKQTEKITTLNFFRRLQISAKQGENITVGSQLTNLSAEPYNPYPPVATEDAYIILHDFISNATGRPAIQSNLLFINSSEVPNVGNVTEKSERKCTDSCRNAIHDESEKSEMPTKLSSNTSTDKPPARAKEEVIGNLSEREGLRPGKWTSPSVTSRHARDDGAVTERLLEASRGKTPINVGNVAQFPTSTTDSSLVTSNGHLRKSGTTFLDILASNETTETTSRNQGGQLISISVENPYRYSSSANTTRRFDAILRTTTGRSSSSSVKKLPPVGELPF